MSYMWNDFNIKTFPAETIVYRNGVYCPDLSTLENKPINQSYDLPVHIIYIGEISGENTLDISVGEKNQNIVISANVTIKTSAILNILIKNAGESSKITGTVLLKNDGDLEYNCNAHHLYKKTGILIKTKLLAGKKSKSKVSGIAVIDKDCDKCESDIALVAMTDPGAKIDFMPGQRIKSEPIRADHSASIYEPTDAQIFYLRCAGLGTFEVQEALKEAFLSE